MSITVEQARKVLSVIDAGLCHGKGVPTPGQMCVEAAVCYGLGLPFDDDPECVEPAIRSFKISLNDRGWSSNKARAKGLRRIGIAQLGSKGAVDGKEFAARLAEKVIRVIVPTAMEAAAIKNQKHAEALRAAGERCRAEGTKDAANAAADAAWGAILALVAYDDCAHMLDSDPDDLRILSKLGSNAATLMIPASIAFKSIREKEKLPVD